MVSSGERSERVETGEFWWGGGLQALLRNGTEPVQPKPAWKLDRLHPSDVHRVQHSFEECVTSARSSWNERYRLRRADGAWAFLEDHAYFLREATGHAYRAIGTVRDVTALHESNEALRKNEERLRAALDASEMSFHVEVAHDAPSALALAKQLRPQIALLDIGLPVMDGYELAARLREQHPSEGIRLVAITGYGQEDDKRRTAAAGFDLHLVKPIDAPALVRAIRALE